MAEHLVGVQAAMKNQMDLNISLDGDSNWLEGAMLLAVYVIAAIGFFPVG